MFECERLTDGQLHVSSGFLDVEGLNRLSLSLTRNGKNIDRRGVSGQDVEEANSQFNQML